MPHPLAMFDQRRARARGGRAKGERAEEVGGVGEQRVVRPDEVQQRARVAHDRGHAEPVHEPISTPARAYANPLLGAPSPMAWLARTLTARIAPQAKA